MAKVSLGLRALVFTAAALGAGSTSRAALDIEITSGVRDPVPIAIVPFGRAAAGDGGLDVAAVIQHDLEGSGRFRALPRERMPALPQRADEVVAQVWKNSGSDYVLVGRVTTLENAALAIDFDLVNSLTGVRLARQRFRPDPCER